MERPPPGWWVSFCFKGCHESSSNLAAVSWQKSSLVATFVPKWRSLHWNSTIWTRKSILGKTLVPGTLTLMSQYRSIWRNIGWTTAISNWQFPKHVSFSMNAQTNSWFLTPQNQGTRHRNPNFQIHQTFTHLLVQILSQLTKWWGHKPGL